MSNSRSYRIGIDVGGTFTDVVIAGGDRGIWFVKTPSTPEDPARGVIDGLALAAEELRLPLKQFLSNVSLLIHGTTVATNILVERNGAKVGMLTTRGFRDLLELRDGTKQRRYQLREQFPELLVPRELRCEIDERLRWDGAVEQPISSAEVDGVLESLRSQGVESLVVCFLHSHRSGIHESMVRDRLHAIDWDPYLSLSHEVLGKIGEYERLSTASVNAYIGPGLRQYLERLAIDVKLSGLHTPMLIMQSNGGVLPAAAAVKKAVGAVTSGPAGGAMSGVLFARSLGLDKVVTYDTGGTSTDVCIIENGHPVEVQAKELADSRISIPTVEINPLAVGGGSIARLSLGGILDIGPRSARARPGPACFGYGGVEPTLTDANVVLGYVSTDTFLGGRMKLSREAAAKAIQDHIATPLGVTTEEAAMAIHAIANSRVAEGVRLATVKRGSDPRDYALISFGGAGGLHADAVAQELQMPTAIIPRQASVLSALGFLAADVRHDFQRPMDLALIDAAPETLQGVMEEMALAGRLALAESGFADEDIAFRRLLDCRYTKQVHSVPIAVSPEDLATGPLHIAKLFEAEYRRLYGHAHSLDQVVVDTVRLSALGKLPQILMPDLPAAKDSNPFAAQRGARRIYLGAWCDAPVYWFDDLAPGMVIEGPALIDSASTSVLVLPDRFALVDKTGTLNIQNHV